MADPAIHSRTCPRCGAAAHVSAPVCGGCGWLLRSPARLLAHGERLRARWRGSLALAAVAAFCLGGAGLAALVYSDDGAGVVRRMRSHVRLGMEVDAARCALGEPSSALHLGDPSRRRQLWYYDLGRHSLQLQLEAGRVTAIHSQ